MSEFEKIPEQEDVINCYDKNLVVSASAGSGKTSVMIRKIIDYILNHDLKIKDILVLTYTNFASDEMRQRLTNALCEAATSRQDLMELIDDIPLADISTFDSFCQKIVKKYFYVLDISPSFSILDNASQKLYQQRALKKTIDVFKAKQPDKYFELFNCFADNRTDKNIYDLVLSIYNYSCSILNYDDFKRNALDLFENQKAENILKQYFDSKLSYANFLLKKLHGKSQKLGNEKYCKFASELMAISMFIKDNKDFSKLIDYCAGLSMPKKPSGDDKLIVDLCYARDIIKEVVDGLKSYVSKEVYKKSIIFCKSNIEVLLSLCDEFKARYTRLKKQKNMYDFDDVERLTIKVLENENIANNLKNQYKKIFIDEFQDANLVQEKIVSLISRDDNLFLVGDLKQAIYGFRQSNSKIFARIIENYKKQDILTGKSKAMLLNCNFRTCKPILNFVNEIFSKIMTTKSAGLDYKNDAKLVAQANFLEEDYNVELDVVVNSQDDEDHVLNKIYSVLNDDSINVSNEKVEARIVAEKITKLLDEKIYDIKTKNYRKITYNDICVLFRTRAKQSEFVEVFERYGIPLLENSNTDLEEVYDVKVLINAIKVCENFNDDIALSSVMMSPLFDFSSDEMLRIRQNGDNKYFYECVEQYNICDELKQKIEKMKDVLQTFYQNYTFKGLFFALNWLVNETQYLYKLSFLENGISRKKNIQSYINSFIDSSFNFSAGKYLCFLNQSTRDLKVTSEVSSYDCVTLTTMHSSKGLEWPIVFCVSMGQDILRSPKTSKLMLSEDLGIGIKYYDEDARKKYDSIYFDVIKQSNFYDDFAEKLRLLYVALTRAKNKLFIVGTTKKLEYEQFINDNEVFRQRSYLDLIIKSLDKKTIICVNSQKSCNIFGQDKFILNVINSDSFKSQPKNDTVLATTSSSDCKELANYIQKKYPQKDVTSIAQKNTVSGLLKEEYEYASQNFQPNKLSISEHNQSQPTTDEGIIYHKILQCIDFEKDINENVISNIISDLKNQSIYDEHLLENIDIALVCENANIIKNIAKNYKVIKEHSFVMKLPYNEISDSDYKDEVLIQGVCDLILFNDVEAILVDYKFSNKHDEQLKSSYNKQIYLYKKAIEKGFMKKVSKCYILSLKKASLIEITPHK